MPEANKLTISCVVANPPALNMEAQLLYSWKLYSFSASSKICNNNLDIIDSRSSKLEKRYGQYEALRVNRLVTQRKSVKCRCCIFFLKASIDEVEAWSAPDFGMRASAWRQGETSKSRSSLDLCFARHHTILRISPSPLRPSPGTNRDKSKSRAGIEHRRQTQIHQSTTAI